MIESFLARVYVLSQFTTATNHVGKAAQFNRRIYGVLSYSLTVAGGRTRSNLKRILEVCFAYGHTRPAPYELEQLGLFLHIP